ncbi:hypothetical protein A2U01_0086222, partial [Trifolium medium]|nr:hypothetical protein [Trifolium medium]
SRDGSRGGENNGGIGLCAWRGYMPFRG